MKRLYRALCRRFGPRGLTFSAWLWARELEGNSYLLREFVDDTFLCFFDQEDHCETQWKRETRSDA